jgi:hypothetical protein
MRDIYASFRGVLKYAENHNVSVDLLTEKLNSGNFKSKSGDSARDIEGFVEDAIGFDLNMKELTKDLHQENANSKEHLGLK